jgi:hypothetical protein
MGAPNHLAPKENVRRTRKKSAKKICKLFGASPIGAAGIVAPI